jgi:hypothetical protein
MHGSEAWALNLYATWRAPLVAFAAALLAALAVRVLRLRPLAPGVAGLGAGAGFASLAGLAWPVSGPLQLLGPVAAAAALVAVLAPALGPRAGVIGGAVLAVLGGWFMAGAPIHLAPSLRWIEAGGLAAVLALGALGLGRLGAGQVVLASLSLGCGMAAARIGHAWILAALVPGAGMLGAALAGGRTRARLAVPPAALAVAAVAAAWLWSVGDLRSFSPRPNAAAVLAPGLALWLAARLAPRLHLAAGGLGLAAATLAVWMIAGGR